MKSKLLVYLVLVVAIGVASIAAFYSVFGLSHLFAGAAGAVIVMGTILEFGKLIVTSVLHQYWEKLNWWLKVYLTVAVITLMTITSAGIYGFLTSAYQTTANKSDIVTKEIKLIENKKSAYQLEIKRIESTIQSKNSRVDKLSNLRLQQESRLDSLYKKNYLKAAKQTEGIIADANKDLKLLEHDIDSLNKVSQVQNDSITVLDKKILQMQLNDTAAAELGPLKYLSNLTGKSMDIVINWFMMLLIFVFDPLAVALVIVFNKIVINKDTVNKSDSNTEHITVSQPNMESNIIDGNKPPLKEGFEGNIDVNSTQNQPENKNIKENNNTVSDTPNVKEMWDEVVKEVTSNNETENTDVPNDDINQFYNEQYKSKKPPYSDSRS